MVLYDEEGNQVGIGKENGNGGLSTVSYTHLDVYKRQGMRKDAMNDIQKIRKQIEQHQAEQEPVSYTHLHSLLFLVIFNKKSR